MGQAADIDESRQPLTWPPAFGDLIRGQPGVVGRARRHDRRFGIFPRQQLSGSLHTDFGPEDQDKDTNQDYALAWLPHDEKARQRFRFAWRWVTG